MAPNLARMRQFIVHHDDFSFGAIRDPNTNTLDVPDGKVRLDVQFFVNYYSQDVSKPNSVVSALDVCSSVHVMIISYDLKKHVTVEYKGWSIPYSRLVEHVVTEGVHRHRSFYLVHIDNLCYAKVTHSEYQANDNNHYNISVRGLDLCAGSVQKLYSMIQKEELANYQEQEQLLRTTKENVVFSVLEMEEIYKQVNQIGFFGLNHLKENHSIRILTKNDDKAYFFVGVCFRNNELCLKVIADTTPEFVPIKSVEGIFPISR